MVGGHTALPVGRSGQGHQGLLAGDRVGELHRVAHGVDVRVGGAHVVIHHDGALLPQGKARPAGQIGLRGHADGQDDQVGSHRRLLPDEGLRLSAPAAEAGNGGAQPQVQALAPQVGVDLAGQVLVQRQQHLVVQLDHGGVDPGVDQVLRHLQTDEAAAHHHGGLRPLPLQEVPDAEGVLHGTQGENALQVDAGQGRPDGLGPRGEDQLVIGLGVLAAILQAADGDGVLLGLHGENFVPDTDVDVEPGPKTLRGLEGQRPLVLDGPPDVVGQTAVGVGDISGPLQNDDLGLLVQAAQAGSGSGPSGHASDDNDFHGVSSLSFGFQWAPVAADAAQVYGLMALPLQPGAGPGAPGAAEAVGKDGPVRGQLPLVQAVQGQIHGPGHMSGAVLLRGAHIQQDGAGDSPPALQSLFKIRAVEQKIKQAHVRSSLCRAAIPLRSFLVYRLRIPKTARPFCDKITLLPPASIS